jgi:hypothetical protein
LAAVAAGGQNVEHGAVKPYFIIGPPSDEKLRKLMSAVAILRLVPNDPEIFDETQIHDLVARIEDEMRTHVRAI